MALRDSMLPLIARVRDLIGDAASASSAPAFSDVQIQQALDEHKRFVRYAPLTADPNRAPGGIISYNTFFAKVGDWEADAQLVGPSYTVLAPATSDYIAGAWTFTTPPPGQPLPVFIIGQTYDIYGAARDLLRRLAARYATAFTFSADGATFNRSAIQQQLRDLADQYEAQMRPQYGSMRRRDTDDGSYGGVPGGVIEAEY